MREIPKNSLRNLLFFSFFLSTTKTSITTQPVLSLATMKFTLATLAMASAALAAQSCGAGQQCPEDAPCCSLYGECGTGSYCLGPCNPKYSYNLTSCAPAPVCKSGDHTFNNLDSVVSNTEYLGDASKADFVANNQVLNYDGNVLLTMANGSTGTVLTSTRAVWYGKISATLKTSRTQGVVSSMILMSGIRDEIDYEFIGSYLEDAQTNYYWQEVLDWQNSQNISLSDTYENFHTYTVDWTEDSITWSIDGQTGRVLQKSDTYNSTTDSYSYPQTPSFVQISIWPGGLASNPEGTIQWAGGEVDWNAQDIQDPGYFYVTLKDVSIECYDTPSGTDASGSKAYVYDDVAGLQSNVKITDDNTVLGSFEAVGFDMDKGSDGSLASVGGSVPTGVGNGQNHASGSSNTASVADASVVSIKQSSTKAASSSSTGTVADASQVSRSSSAASSTGASSAQSTDDSDSSSTSDDSSETSAASSAESSAASSSAASSSAAASSADAGFQQGGDSGSSSSASGNSGVALNVAGSMLALAGTVFAATFVF